MIKIAKTVAHCNECPHFVSMENIKETRFYGICDFREYSDEDQVQPDQTMIVFAENKPTNRYTINIPHNCPLETYTPKQDEHQN